MCVVFFYLITSFIDFILILLLKIIIKAMYLLKVKLLLHIVICELYFFLNLKNQIIIFLVIYILFENSIFYSLPIGIAPNFYNV